MNKVMKGVSSIIGIWLVLNLVMVSAGDRFVENSDGTVTDLQLKLIWFYTDNQGDISWEDAVRWTKYGVPFVTTDPSSDNWRLPTVSELQSLYLNAPEENSTLTDCGMRVRIIPQIHLTCGWVWSAEESGTSANVFTFRLGYHFSEKKKHRKSHRVLAVRDLEG